MFPRNTHIQNGDQRTFYKGEKVAINDGYFTNGIYKSSVENTEGIITTHIITSIRNEIFPNRWVDSSHVGKIIVSPTILKNVCVSKIGDPYLTNWILMQGY
jgi:hypothetical protein